MKISKARNWMLSLSLALVGICLMAPVVRVMAQDTRSVTEPTIPAVCQELSAQFTQTYNVAIAGTDGISNVMDGVDGLDVSSTVDARVTNPDGARIQAALTACAGTGEAVELSMDSTSTFNAFISGPLAMPAGVTLLVDPGVTLFFSRNAQDYDSTPNTNSCGTYGGSGSCKALISMASNDALMGYGKISGRGGDIVINGYQASSSFPAPTTITWWSLAKQADITGGSQVNPVMIVPAKNSSNVTLYKITLLNSPMFHVKPGGVVNGFTAWDMKIITPTWARNTDGIDPQPVNNGTIINSWISDGDDNVALGASGTPGPTVTAQNLSITNNHFYAGHGESIGSFTSGTVQNAVWSGNMSAGNGYSGKASAINSFPYTVQTNSISPSKGPTVYPVHFADSVGPSTGIRIKSAQNSGGLVTNITYDNECLLDHLEDIQFTPLYSTSAGSLTPDFTGITFENLAFLNDAGSFGTVQFTGTHTTVSGTVITNPLGLTMSNVSFPSTLSLSDFVTTGSKGTEQYANITYGPGNVSSNFINDWATFVAVPANNDTATNNITVPSLNPPQCNFTYIAPELTGPKNVPQTITYGQTATAVVILTPVVGGAPWPTGAVILTDELTGNTTNATMPGNFDTLFVPLTGLVAGTHTFNVAYAGDSNYAPSIAGQPYTTAGPYTITVDPAAATVSLSNLVQTYTGFSISATATTNPFGLPVTLTYNGLTAAPTAAGIYAVNATIPNYTGTATGTLTINPAPLTVTANNASMPVGGPLPAFTASYSGFLNEDSVAVLSGGPSLTTTATTFSGAGLYPITAAAGTLAAANYAFNFVNGTLSVVQAPAVTLVTTSSVSGSHSAGYIATITVKNTGGSPASNVVLSAAMLGTTSGTSLPQTGGTIAPGGTATFMVAFPGSAGLDGAGVAEKLSGTYTGGTFAGNIRSVTLP
ncbi:MAG: glycosyl hydrolase family 28 protein [Terracidiphilus sp.]